MVAPEGSVVPVIDVALHQVAGKMSRSATRAKRNTRKAVRTGGVLENLWDAALRVQQEYDIVIGVSYDWLPFYLTPFFSTPVAIGSASVRPSMRWTGSLRSAGGRAG